MQLLSRFVMCCATADAVRMTLRKHAPNATTRIPLSSFCPCCECVAREEICSQLLSYPSETLTHPDSQLRLAS